MSSRALRKLQENKSSLYKEGESGEEEIVGPPKSRTNAFNAFNLLDDGCSESEIKEDDEDDGASTTLQKPQPEKRKKKRKKKAGNIASKKSEEEIDEIDSCLKELEMEQGNNIISEESYEENINPIREILNVQSKHLNPENELKRIFGARVVATSSSRQRKTRGGRPHPRSSVLVTPKPTWPPTTKCGLSMRPAESTQNGSWFLFEHNSSYQAIQRRFLSAVEALNPDLIMALLNSHPMHIDSMLQLSDICKMGDDSSMAAELVERTLFALESSFHPCFNLLSGNCHLDYRHQENRAIFIALFRHLNFVGARACYRTALELCKILLTLDPSTDPLATVLMIDFFALRSRSFQWLIDLFEAWNPSRNLVQLPNFAYSVALAKFHVARGSENGLEMADKMLQRALISFPSVLLSLLDKCSIEPHPDVMGCQFFLDNRAEPAALKSLCALYTSRTFHCWKEPEILPWLEKNVTTVLKKITENDPRIKESASERSTRYQGLPRNIHRHIMISDCKEALSHLPKELKEEPGLAWDPLPPLNSIDTYGPPERQSMAIDDPSALRMFFRSLLPNFDPNEPALNLGEEEGAAAAAAGGELRNSVNGLLDAMRNLLGNLQLPEHPNEAEDEASDEDRD